MIDHSILSPSGRVSKRQEKTAKERVRLELFGPNGLQRDKPIQPSEAEALLRQAAELRQLASGGMKPRAYVKKAIELETKARFLKACGAQS